MPKLPANIDFDETHFPGLEEIFRDVDQAIAAIIASDPAFRATRLRGRRGQLARAAVAGAARPRHTRRAAA